MSVAAIMQVLILTCRHVAVHYCMVGGGRLTYHAMMVKVRVGLRLHASSLIATIDGFNACIPCQCMVTSSLGDVF